jgi:hypothetical protein
VSYDESNVTIYDDAIDPSLIVGVLKEIKGQGFQFGWHSNKGFEFSHWNQNFGGSKKERYDCAHLMPLNVRAVWEGLKLARVISPDFRPIRAYVNAQTFGTEGYPHTDSQVESDLSIVIYLNPEWKPEWAGETAFFDDDDDLVKSVLPRFGRVSIFPGAMMHAARGVSRVCPECRYVLVFKAACE